MNITYPSSCDEATFKKLALSIYKEVEKYYVLICKSKNHPKQFTFTEWRDILSDIMTGFFVLTVKENPDLIEKQKIDRGLFLLCRYFYDLRG